MRAAGGAAGPAAALCLPRPKMAACFPAAPCVRVSPAGASLKGAPHLCQLRVTDPPAGRGSGGGRRAGGRAPRPAPGGGSGRGGARRPPVPPSAADRGGRPRSAARPGGRGLRSLGEAGGSPVGRAAGPGGAAVCRARCPQAALRGLAGLTQHAGPDAEGLLRAPGRSARGGRDGRCDFNAGKRKRGGKKKEREMTVLNGPLAARSPARRGGGPAALGTIPACVSARVTPPLRLNPCGELQNGPWRGPAALRPLQRRSLCRRAPARSPGRGRRGAGCPAGRWLQVAVSCRTVGSCTLTSLCNRHKGSKYC